jgi:hypothetical protein
LALQTARFEHRVQVRAVRRCVDPLFCPSPSPSLRSQRAACCVLRAACCAGYSYWGPRAFERHFKEWRHAYGLKCLGIPNLKEFMNGLKPFLLSPSLLPGAFVIWAEAGVCRVLRLVQ